MIFTKEELIKKEIPKDLQQLINNYECCEDLLEEMECRFFEEGEIPELISHSYLDEEDKKNKNIMATVSASNELIKHISFVVEAIDGNLVGYWHGSENTDLKNSSIVKYDTEGQFSILPGGNLVESLVGDYLFDEDEEFLEFQNKFKDCGIEIVSKWDDLVEPKLNTDPKELFDKLYEEYLN